ncbi:DNA internalization-related competence protein ComEC/Rec2 [Meiothermus granaticius]|uniref:ComE operon protein 3 n=1 Tax=Meiothermus granaticius NBRC 107808 TaxID=1227551 RepID=A0A399FCQ2_9DEIN|nr:DNA internalization-related competence protein ComEC/Rec2 [Meiothermus granaticius]RIH92802.1 ComE operon protein 3 [Meiothermus granaticius NBRC 107808]GEM87380.1 DNA internalization-related competence protein ComEC/Rec2 [Meiothermus granaticius NBRC 107808]
MIPYALGLGALLGALSSLTPWAFVGMLAGLGLPQAVRWAGLLAYALVALHLALIHDPWGPQIGRWVQLQGEVRQGFVQIPEGTLYVRHFPQTPDGYYALEGRLRRPKGARNPGGFDEATWLKGLGITAVLEVHHLSLLHPQGGVRPWLEAQLMAGLSPAASALNRAITLGEGRELGETYTEFQRAGLAHALALSGLNVGILVGFFVLLLYKLGRWRYLAALGLLLLYLLLVGPQPSLVRAVIMAAFVLVGLFLGKGKVELLPALLLALALHLIIWPHALYSLSFQLSYLAVLGLAVVWPRLPQLPGWKGWLWASLGLTLAAQVFLLPLLLHSFHALPLLSPLSNLLVLPLLNLLVPLGFLKLLLGGVLAWPVEWLSQAVLKLVGWLAQGPQLYWGEISPVGFILYFLALGPLLLALYGRLGWSRAMVLSATAVLASLLPLPFQRGEIWQLDVGQGDASLIRLPGGVEILVDGGRDWAYPRLEGALRALGVDDLDLVIATHADADHIGALPQLIRNFPVQALVTGPRRPGDPNDDDLRQAAQDRHVKVIQAGFGSLLAIPGARLRFLNPYGDEASDNELSLVFVLETAGRKALFTGDAPLSSEERWAGEAVSILKVGHHGSASSTGQKLLQRFHPQIALIGVGSNTYGHPTAQVLERLDAWGVEIHRTDVEGAIRVGLW